MEIARPGRSLSRVMIAGQEARPEKGWRFGTLIRLMVLHQTTCLSVKFIRPLTVRRKIEARRKGLSPQAAAAKRVSPSHPLRRQVDVVIAADDHGIRTGTNSNGLLRKPIKQRHHVATATRLDGLSDFDHVLHMFFRSRRP
jgi:hypothetical protein